MAFPKLTPEVIKEICESASGQEAIAKLAQTMNSQGITKMFIDYEEVRRLVRKMMHDGIWRADMEIFTDNAFTEKMAEFFTEKSIGYISMVENVEKMPAENGLPMLKEFAGIYLLEQFRPMMVFYWMAEFASIYKITIENLVNLYFKIYGGSPDKHAMYLQMINDAIPMGINSKVHALAWVNANEEEFAKLDFSEILKAIEFDRYYREAFEKTTEEMLACNAEGENNLWKFVPKSEIRRLADSGFKPLVLDIVFPEAKSLSIPDINAAIDKLFKEKPTLVYMLYARAMFYVKASELQRFQKQFMQMCDVEGIDYTVIPNQIDPRMFKENPWSGNFS